LQKRECGKLSLSLTNNWPSMVELMIKAMLSEQGKGWSLKETHKDVYLKSTVWS